MWYLARYHDIKISSGAVYNVLKRNGLNKLPQNERKRSIKPFKRYEKQVPGHRIQIDVKFLSFKDPAGRLKKLYQYTAIDDATATADRSGSSTENLSEAQSADRY
jgi:hypothetical protein